MNRPLFILLLIVLIVPKAAHALCVGTVITELPATTTFQGAAGEYSVFDPVQYMQTVNFKVESLAGLGGCRYFVTLDTGSSGASANRTMVRAADALNYNAYTDVGGGTILDSAGSYNSADVISGNLPFIIGVNQSNNHSFFWTIAPQQVESADILRFEDSTVNLRVWAELAFGIYTNTDTDSITFRARAESDVALSLVDSGGALNLSDTAQAVDFGTLTSGEMLAYDTIVRSNDGYVVTFQSQNAQVLRHTDFPAVPNTVSYAVDFDGGALDLSSGGVITGASSTNVTPAIGARFPTLFTVGTLSGGEPAGDYQDIIAVTLSAN